MELNSIEPNANEFINAIYLKLKDGCWQSIFTDNNLVEYTPGRREFLHHCTT